MKNSLGRKFTTPFCLNLFLCFLCPIQRRLHWVLCKRVLLIDKMSPLPVTLKFTPLSLWNIHRQFALEFRDAFCRKSILRLLITKSFNTQTLYSLQKSNMLLIGRLLLIKQRWQSSWSWQENKAEKFSLPWKRNLRKITLYWEHIILHPLVPLRL